MAMDEYAIYLRKSRSDLEAEARGEGETLARHENTLIALAKSLNIKVSKIYKEIVSGETIAARPEMQNLLADVEKGLWAGVLVMEIERLARGDTIDQGIVAQTFKYSGTKIITPTKTYDPNNEFDEEYFEFGLFMSRREYKTIKRRLQSGRLASVNEGKYVANQPPYGYKRVKLQGQKGYTLEPIPEEADIVRLIFNWYTKGEQQEDGIYRRLGVSLIARRLNQLKIKPRKADAWVAVSIRDILINPVYAGMIRWNWRPQKKKIVNGRIIKERPRSEDVILKKGLHEPIISEEIFNQAQELMSKNPAKPVGERYTIKNPLAGLVECGLCHRKMIRRPYSEKTKYDTLMCPAPHCKNVSAKLSDVEDAILDALKKLLAEYRVQVGTNVNPDDTILTVINNKIQLLEKQLRETKQQLNKVYDLLEKEIYTTEQFFERSGVLNKQIEELNTDIEKLKNEYKNEELRIQKRTEIIPKLENIINIYAKMPTAQAKNEVLKEVIEKVEYIKEKSARYKGVDPKDFTIKIYPILFPKTND